MMIYLTSVCCLLMMARGQTLFPQSVPYPMQIDITHYEVADAIYETLTDEAKAALASVPGGQVMLYYMGFDTCVYISAVYYPQVYEISPPGRFKCRPTKTTTPTLTTTTTPDAPPSPTTPSSTGATSTPSTTPAATTPGPPSPRNPPALSN